MFQSPFGYNTKEKILDFLDQLSKGSNNYESYIVKAGLQRKDISFDSAGEYVFVKNMSEKIPVWIGVDDYISWDEEDSHRIRLEPGESVGFYRKDTEIMHYIAVCSEAELKIVVTDVINETNLNFNPPEYKLYRAGRRRIYSYNNGRIWGHVGRKVSYSDNKGMTSDGLNDYIDFDEEDGFEGQSVRNVFVTDDDTLLINLTADDKKGELHRVENASQKEEISGDDLEKVIDNCFDWYNTVGIAQSESGTIIFCEYATGTSGVDFHVYRSDDDGKNWESTLEISDEEILHFHSIDFDPSIVETKEKVTNWYLTSGDDNEHIKWWLSEDDGKTWSEIEEVGGKQDYRTLGLIITNDYIIWGTDSRNENYIFRAEKDNLNKKEELYFTHPAIFAAEKYDDVIYMGLADIYDISNTGKTYILASKDGGNSWEKVLSWKLSDRGNREGFVSCVPTPEGLYFGRENLEEHGAANHGHALSIRLQQ